MTATLLLALSAVLATAPASYAASPPWLGAELFYLELMNCTRTGGWVLADGTCDRYGSGHYSAYREPLKRRADLSRLVARPYAKKLTVQLQLSHYYGGSPEARMREAGFHGTAYGENLAWAGKSARQTMIWASRYFQDEKSYGGAHWKQLKAARFTHVGIGVWRRDGRTYLAVDFYRP